MSTALETQTAETAQKTALAEVQAEYPKYFEALNQHPRLLIGKEVPRVGGEGMETLRDSSDAAEWQAAVKDVLLQEVKDRAIRHAETAAPSMQTLHQSIELFQNNVDLIPGTAQFDTDLANRFATLAKPYEHRVDGKLHGYTIPVQPIIDSLRQQLVTERAAVPAPAPVAAPAGAPAAAPPAQPPVEQPQSGIPAKAGASAEPAEDFSALFGTLGIPDFRI